MFQISSSYKCITTIQMTYQRSVNIIIKRITHLQGIHLPFYRVKRCTPARSIPLRQLELLLHSCPKPPLNLRWSFLCLGHRLQETVSRKKHWCRKHLTGLLHSPVKEKLHYMNLNNIFLDMNFVWYCYELLKQVVWQVHR